MSDDAPASALPPTPLIGNARSQELLETASKYLYRELPEGKLNAWLVHPADLDLETERLPALVFLHGGMWDISTPHQFIPHCHHFVTRGMITITANYRTRENLGGGPLEAMEDVRQLITFLKTHAHVLGIDASRITVVGASSGGHAALCSVLHPAIGPHGEIFRPDGLILFGPISDTHTRKGSTDGKLRDLFPNPRLAKVSSPQALLPQKNLPPCLLMHGTENKSVPFETSTRLAKLYRKKGNHCELNPFTGQGHTFFNYNPADPNYDITLRMIDHFLVEQNLLEPDPEPDLVS